MNSKEEDLCPHQVQEFGMVQYRCIVLAKRVGPGTTLARPGWKQNEIFSEGGLAQLKGSGFNKGCILLYYSFSEFESLTVSRSCRDVLH